MGSTLLVAIYPSILYLAPRNRKTFMFNYITRRPLWVNLLIAIGIVLVIFTIAILSLNWITKHGEASSVPSLVGKNMNEVQKILDEKGFSMVIQDSVYYDSLPPGVVVK